MINIQSNARCPVYAMSFDGRTTIEDSTKYLNMIAKSAAEDFNFPYLYDNQQVVAKNFGAQKTPHAIALVEGELSWTYQELNEWTNQICTYLIENCKVAKGDSIWVVHSKSSISKALFCISLLSK